VKNFPFFFFSEFLSHSVTFPSLSNLCILSGLQEIPLHPPALRSRFFFLQSVFHSTFFLFLFLRFTLILLSKNFFFHTLGENFFSRDSVPESCVELDELSLGPPFILTIAAIFFFLSFSSFGVTVSTVFFLRGVLDRDPCGRFFPYEIQPEVPLCFCPLFPSFVPTPGVRACYGRWPAL